MNICQVLIKHLIWESTVQRYRLLVAEAMSVRRLDNYADLARQRMSKKRRKERPAAAIIDANNFVKNALLDMAITSLPGDDVTGALTALDACSGRGGDLHKFAAQSRVTTLTLLDENEQAVQESERRWKESKVRTPLVYFTVGDLADPELLDGLGECTYDIITVHFALHYLFETTHRAYDAIKNLSRLCKPGGLVIVTVPNEDAVRTYAGPDLVKIDWECGDRRVARKYKFTMANAVEHVEEWIVPEIDLVTMFGANELLPEAHMTGPFPDIYERFVERTKRDFSCSVRNMRNRTPLTADEKLCFKLYSAYTFRKTNTQTSSQRPPFGRRLVVPPAAGVPSGAASSVPLRDSSFSSTSQD